MEHQDQKLPEGLDPQAKESRKRGKKARSSRRRTIVALLVILALLMAAPLTFLQLWRSGRWQPSDELKQTLLHLADSTELMEHARALKDDLKELTASLSDQDAARAEDAREKMQQDLHSLKREFASPAFLAASLAPGIGDEIRSARELLQILDEADGGIIGPYIELMRTRPLTGLNTEEGIRVDLLNSYLDFIEQILPQAGNLTARMQNIDLSLVDTDGKLSSYLSQLSGLLGGSTAPQDYLPAVRAILGDGSDRLYIFAAQNSSEIRASGGFPGSVGLIRIRDGLLTISEFESVYKVFQSSTPASAAISYTEEVLFSGRMHLSWDSDFSPDFERVAEIWALAYEARNHEPVNGVISGTPAIIQRMLSFLGSVTLSDGTELNGDNATRVLGHDIYFNYLGANQRPGAAAYVDSLFAEAAKETLGLLMSQMNARMFASFYSFFLESTADRTMMVWLADEAEQELIRRAGWNAGLNTDPTRPQIGIFFNSTEASKMAWFLNIEPELSEPVRNEDGSQTYELTVRFVNTMTPEERAAASGYILGGTGGITGSLYVFAPAGGRIDEAVTQNGYVMRQEVYEDLALTFMTDVTAYADWPIVIHCRITTSPEAQAPAELMITPTMQNYR